MLVLVGLLESAKGSSMLAYVNSPVLVDNYISRIKSSSLATFDLSSSKAAFQISCSFCKASSFANFIFYSSKAVRNVSFVSYNAYIFITIYLCSSKSALRTSFSSSRT